MNKICFIAIVLTSIACFSCVHAINKSDILTERIDSLLITNPDKPFNGIILITKKGGETIYSKVSGYSDLDKKTPLQIDDQFVVGSISKQFTAVIVLREYDKGRLDLHIPIKTYLPDLTESWADTVTAHHLLTHTHGIMSLDKPTAFPVGTQYSYSQIGYDLLASIVEKTSGKSFIELSAGLFEQCDMNDTFHPELKVYKNLVKGYLENEDGILEYTDESLSQHPTSPAFEGLTMYPAAGMFISTAEDLSLWNKNLIGGELLKENTFRLMVSKHENAIRNHSLFGHIAFGYGITIDDKDEIMQWGQTGYIPGFVSMDFYFPESSMNVIVLENINYDVSEIKKTFYYHTQILNLVRDELLK